MIRKNKQVSLQHLFLSSFCHCGGEDEIVKLLVVGMKNLILGALPPLFALMDIDNLVANLHHGVHIVGIDNGGYVVLNCDVVNEVVDND